MLIRLIRFFRGTARFTVRGGFLERFLNLCAQNRVPVWDGRRAGDSYTARTTLRGSRALPELARKAGVALEAPVPGGAPAFLRRYRKRTGLFAGAGMVAVALVVLGSFIWQVEVVGLQTVPEEEVLSILEELGVRRGALRRDIDARRVERLLMIRLDEAAWVAVNLRGSTAVVEIQERVAPPEPIDDDVPHNVAAAKPGFITYMEVYSGQPTVKAGDSVDTGEILVSGIMEDQEGRSRTVHARAKVLAQTRETLSVEVPYREEELVPRGVEVRRYLEIASLRLPLSLGGVPDGPWKAEKAAFRIPFLSALVPVSWSRENYILLGRETRELTPAEARARAMEELEREEGKALAGAEILDRQLTGQELSDRFLLEAVYLCEEDISEEREILTG